MFFVIDTLSRNTMEVVYNLDSRQMASVNMSDVPLIFTVMSGEYIIDEPDRVFNISLQYYKVFSELNLTTGENQIMHVSQNIALEPCDIEKHFCIHKDRYNTGYVPSTYCTTPGANNLTLFGSYGDI